MLVATKIGLDYVRDRDPLTASETLETVELRPTRTNINVRLLALVWLPFTRDAMGLLMKEGFIKEPDIKLLEEAVKKAVDAVK